MVVGAICLMTGPVQESGLLAAATGENSERIGIDSGLFQAMTPLYDDATSAGIAIQVRWTAAGRLQHFHCRLVACLPAYASSAAAV